MRRADHISTTTGDSTQQSGRCPRTNDASVIPHRTRLQTAARVELSLCLSSRHPAHFQSSCRHSTMFGVIWSILVTPNSLMAMMISSSMTGGMSVVAVAFSWAFPRVQSTHS